MLEFPLPSNELPGPQRFLDLGFAIMPCWICRVRFPGLRWPMPPCMGLPVCDLCISINHHMLECLTTMEARQKYRVKDLSKLPWVSSPVAMLKTRFYREFDVRVQAIREQGGPKCFQKAQDAWQTRAIKRRRKTLVKHYADLARLGRDFSKQALLAGLNPMECVDLREKLESHEDEADRMFKEEALQQLSLLRRMVPPKCPIENWSELEPSAVDKAKWARVEYPKAIAPLPSDEAYESYKFRVLHGKWRHPVDIWAHIYLPVVCN